MPSTITAAVALSNLKGNLAIAKTHLLQTKRNGVDSANAEKQVEVLKYAIASVEANKLNRKSAFKELERAKAANGPRDALDPEPETDVEYDED